jgi:hypothetical protein
MRADIPYDYWIPITVDEVMRIFADAPFQWCLAGGYAVEQFLGRSIRAHGDIDVMVFRDEQLAAQRWLRDWQFYAADPAGTLRKWHDNEYLPYGIHDIWGHKLDSNAWQLQLMLAEVEGDEWFSRRNHAIRGKRADLMTEYNGIPCIRIDVQMLYKAKNSRAKDELDFQACLPLLDNASKKWLKGHLLLTHPEAL